VSEQVLSRRELAFQIVYDKLVEAMEQGVAPWQKAWTVNRPMRFCGQPYKGINRFILGSAPYNNPYWMSFNEITKRGGRLKPLMDKEGQPVLKDNGQPAYEKSTYVVYWKVKTYYQWVKEEEEDPETGEVKEVEKRVERTYRDLRFFNVWNVEQTTLTLDDLPERIKDHIESIENGNNDSPIGRAERIIEGYELNGGPHWNEAGGAAFYAPSLDAVQVPPRKSFKSMEHFYKTLFHEFGHSTGAPGRLNREEGMHNLFGDHQYSQEELVAEMCAAFLCNEAGIDMDSLTEQSAAYIEHWLEVLKNDKKMLVYAAAQAEKAAEYILGNSEEGRGIKALDPEHLEYPIPNSHPYRTEEERSPAPLADPDLMGEGTIEGAYGGGPVEVWYYTKEFFQNNVLPWDQLIMGSQVELGRTHRFMGTMPLLEAEDIYHKLQAEQWGGDTSQEISKVNEFIHRMGTGHTSMHLGDILVFPDDRGAMMVATHGFVPLPEEGEAILVNNDAYRTCPHCGDMVVVSEWDSNHGSCQDCVARGIVTAQEEA